MERRGFAAVMVAAMCGLHVSAARGDGVVYPQGTFARLSEEKTVIVWDAAHDTEHLIRTLTLKGDSETFGILVATPTVPTVAKEGDDVIERVANVFVPKTDAGVTPNRPDVDVLTRAQVGAFEAVTIKATDEHALADWLARNHFVDKPALHAWEKAHIDKGWVLTAFRCSAQGTGDRKLAVATVRLSFKPGGAPFFPYAEAVVDPTDETAYSTKYNNQPRYRGYTYGTQPLDVYVVADRQLQAVLGQTTAGPAVADAMRVTQATLASALGDTSAWGFDPKSQPTWVITHLYENVWQRTTHGDLGFASYDLPKARPGPGITEADDRPIGPTFPASSMQWMNPDGGSGKPVSPHKTLFRIGAIALLFLIAGVVGYAVMTEQAKTKA
jgi:hypothetical protein